MSTEQAAPKQEPPTSSLGSTLLKPETSLLKKWLDESKNPDADIERKNRWNGIGREVFERKALLLAAATDLYRNNIANPMQLAATDIFVEKAQGYLTQRGRIFYVLGTLTAVLAILVLLFAAWFIINADVAGLLGVTRSSDHVSRAYLWVLILKSSTAAAFIGGIAYFLVSLSRALLHEGTVLFSRRHSLRFGRLFVYLKSQEMSREDLEAIFNWNAEFSTAFRDIRPENIGKHPLVRGLESTIDGLKAVTEMLTPAVESLTRKNRTPSSE